MSISMAKTGLRRGGHGNGKGSAHGGQGGQGDQ
jgi:hypothetical protein